MKTQSAEELIRHVIGLETALEAAGIYEEVIERMEVHAKNKVAEKNQEIDNIKEGLYRLSNEYETISDAAIIRKSSLDTFIQLTF